MPAHLSLVTSLTSSRTRCGWPISGCWTGSRTTSFFLRCNPDHHTVNFIRGSKIKMHHIAFEMKDFAHIQDACELLALRKMPINWGPVRHGPGHNVERPASLPAVSLHARQRTRLSPGPPM